MTTQEQRAAFGATVRRLREARRWSQADLAEQLGVAPTTVAKWEQGGGARDERVRSIEAVFGLDGGALGWLLGQTQPPEMHTPEIALEADDSIPAEHKRTLLAHLAEVRKIAEGS
jgi:transcriptional regulator with XRE-family HTH domain